MTDFAQLERVSRRSLRMYDLTKRERLIAEVIIDYSFGHGRETAVIPELQAFVDLTGLDKGNVSRALELLFARGIVQRSGPLDARVYAFIPSAAFWRERKPLYDMERAIARADELERISETAPAFDRRGQKMLPLPADEPGLDEGMAMAAREDAGGIVETTTAGGVVDLTIAKSTIVETTMTGRVVDSTTERHSARARETLRNVRVHNVTKRRQFADEDKNFVFETLEELARGPDFEQYRGKWIRRVCDFPGVIREAVGDVKLYLSNPRNKPRKSVGALIFKRAQTIAREAGKSFRSW
jgi:hypothetical protein